MSTSLQKIGEIIQREAEAKAGSEGEAKVEDKSEAKTEEKEVRDAEVTDEKPEDKK